MASKTFQSTGIVLNSFPFKEKDKILTLFTKERGIVKLFVKGKLFFNQALTERYTVSDFLYSQGRGDLYQFCDATVLEQNPQLRHSFEALQMGEKLGSAILRSQWQGKEAPYLFELFLAFLKKVPEEGLYAPFLLKILKHEGILQLEPVCSSCGSHLGKGWRFGGERFCENHAPSPSIELNEKEEEYICKYYGARSFETLLSPTPFLDFVSKVETLFTQAFDL